MDVQAYDHRLRPLQDHQHPARLIMCKSYNINKLPNAWLTEHAKSNRNNVRNYSVKFMFYVHRARHQEQGYGPARA